MRTHIRHKNFQIDSWLRDAIRRVLYARLGRLSREVAFAAVHLEDVNGPRGGVDKRCLVELSGPRVGTIVARGRASSPLAAVSLALHRARHAVVQALARVKGRWRRRWPRSLRDPSSL